MVELKFLIAFFLAFTAGILAIKLGILAILLVFHFQVP